MTGENLINVFAKYAPSMPIGEVMGIVRDYNELKEENKQLSDALLVLLVDIFVVTENGNIVNDDLCKRITASPRLKVAVDKALQVHCGWACSPFSGGVKAALERLDREAANKKR